MSEVTEMPQVMLGSNGNLKPEAPAGYVESIDFMTFEIFKLYFSGDNERYW